MTHSILLKVKDEKIYCGKENGDVNIHSMVHPINKTKISEVCDNWKPDCPEKCRYYKESKR